MTDRAALVERKAKLHDQIHSLMDLDADNALVPHGIGGLARTLFNETVYLLAELVANLTAAEATVASLKAELEDMRAKCFGCITPAEHAEALTARVSELTASNERLVAEPGVRGLEWERGPSVQVAITTVGEYRITEHMGFEYHTHLGDKAVGDGPWRTEGEAKAAAQRDYEARIRSALVPAVGEAVAWQRRFKLARDGWGGWELISRELYERHVADPDPRREQRPLYAHPSERERSLREALAAWEAAYPESDPDNSVDSLWGRYGSEFAHAMKLTRAALSREEQDR